MTAHTNPAATSRSPTTARDWTSVARTRDGTVRTGPRSSDGGVAESADSVTTPWRVGIDRSTTNSGVLHFDPRRTLPRRAPPSGEVPPHRRPRPYWTG